MEVIDETEALQRFFEGKKVYWSPVDVSAGNDGGKNESRTNVIQRQIYQQ